MKSRVASKIIKAVLIVIILLIVSFIFIDHYAMSKPKTVITLNRNDAGNLVPVDPDSDNQGFDLAKEKEIADLLTKFDRIDSADVSVFNKTADPSVSIVIGINQELDDNYIDDIITMLISKIENLKKDHIVIMDNENNIVYT